MKHLRLILIILGTLLLITIGFEAWTVRRSRGGPGEIPGTDIFSFTPDVPDLPPDLLQAENRAYEHLDEVLDRFHRVFHVYQDLSAAGNHFPSLGRICSPDGQKYLEIEPGYTADKAAGLDCIRCRLRSAPSRSNWGGWYFLHGGLERGQIVPSVSWGTVKGGGLDLRGATKLTFFARGEKGGERVEFFCFGVGWNPETGDSNAPYPDSSKKRTLGIVTLTDTWQRYTIDLASADLSFVVGGFAWAAEAKRNNGKDITFYIDEIQYDLARLEEPRFLVSYDCMASDDDFDTVMRNVAFGYDNALVLMAYLARGRPEDRARARIIADAFLHAMLNDRIFKDFGIRNAYKAGDCRLWPGWLTDRPGSYPMPGWWVTNRHTWWEDYEQVGSLTGNVAWPMLAMIDYYEKCGGENYLRGAIKMGEWIQSETYDTRGYGGYSGGFGGWEKARNNPVGQSRFTWKSTEHNMDVYVCFTRLYLLTHDEKWLQRALHAKRLAEGMWSPSEHHFYTGTDLDGKTIMTYTFPLDIQPWGIMSLGSVQIYGPGLEWCEKNCYLETDGFKGFDFNEDKDGIWFEGTGHMAVAYQITGQWEKSDALLREIAKSQTQTPASNGKGIPATSRDKVTTGFHWRYYNRLHIGATAWFLFGTRRYNPYWGIPTWKPVPQYD